MSKWLPIETAPAPDGYIDMWPQFYDVDEATVLRYAHDEGEAICLIRAKLDRDEAQWDLFGWLPLPTAAPEMIAELQAARERIAALDRALEAALPWVESGPAGSWRDAVIARINAAKEVQS